MFMNAEKKYLIPPSDSSGSRSKTSNIRFCSALPFLDACVYVDNIGGWQKSQTDTVGKKKE